MEAPSRFKLLFIAVLLCCAVLLFPLMRRMRVMDVCLSNGNLWDSSTRQCVAPINPHPSVSDTATPRVKRRIVPAH